MRRHRKPTNTGRDRKGLEGETQTYASGRGTISAVVSLQTWDTAIFRMWKNVVSAQECQSLMSRWWSYCQFTQATIKSLILTAVMCVFECISFRLISGLYFQLTHSFLSGAMHCLSWLILHRQQAFISAFPILTS